MIKIINCSTALKINSRFTLLYFSMSVTVSVIKSLEFALKQLYLCRPCDVCRICESRVWWISGSDRWACSTERLWTLPRRLGREEYVVLWLILAQIRVNVAAVSCISWYTDSEVMWCQVVVMVVGVAQFRYLGNTPKNPVKNPPQT